MNTAQKLIQNLLLKIGVFALLVVFILIPSQVLAQNFDIASRYTISDKSAVNGDILSSTEKGIERANVSYDNHLFGVIQDNPLMVYSEASGSGQPIARTGDVEVKVSNFNGNLALGDHVTSSPLQGYGMKATQSGYTVGTVTGVIVPVGNITYNSKLYQTGTIKIALKIEYSEITTARNANRLLEYIGLAFFRNVQDPEKFTQLVKAIIAGLIAISSFAFGFFAFMRAIAKGVEAIGRNPLAKRTIQVSILMQLVLNIVTTVIGIGAAFLILRL